MVAKNDATIYGEPCVEVTLVSLAYAVASDGESDEGDDTDFRMIDDAEIKALNQLRSLDLRRNTLRVTNLIDFSECDLPTAQTPPTSAVTSLSEEMESMRQRAQRATDELRRHEAELEAVLLQVEVECAAMIGWEEGMGPSGTVMLARCQTCHSEASETGLRA